MNILKTKLSRAELNEYKNSLKLTTEQKEVLIGGLFGDLNLRKIGNYSRLVVEQKNKEYLFHLYEIFKDFIRTEPKERLQKRLETSEWKSTWYFSTISHPEFEYYYNLFYKDNIKIVDHILLDELTPRAIAYWFMDDGSRQRNNYLLSTCCFTLEEHYLFVKFFKDNYNISCTIQKKNSTKKTMMLYIRSSDRSNDRFRLLVEPYIVDSMKYKLYPIELD